MVLKIERFQPEGMNIRMSGGKPSYSHVVTVNGPGKTIYVAGQLARDAEGNIVGPGDMRAQMEQTFKNLDACLKAAGAGWADTGAASEAACSPMAAAQSSSLTLSGVSRSVTAFWRSAPKP